MSAIPRALLVLTLALTTPALAQDAGDDWDLRRERDLTVADAIFDNGVGIGVRCQDGGFGVVIVGLPEASAGDRRTLSIGFGDREPYSQTWITSTNPRVAYAMRPAPFARRLREGGAMTLVVPDGAGPGRNLRYELDLPPSRAAIGSVMETCGVPAVDPRDALLSDGEADGSLPSDLTWARRPLPDFPSKAWSNRVGGGLAVISCLTQDDGRLDNCIVESEHPMGAGFGQEALRAVRRSRVRASAGDAGSIGRQYIIFSMSFATDGSAGSGSTRIPRSRERADN